MSRAAALSPARFRKQLHDAIPVGTPKPELIIDEVAAARNALQAAVDDALLQSFKAAGETGSPELLQTLLRALEDPTLSARIRALVPRVSPWAETIGPVYDTDALCRVWGVRRQAVGERKANRTLLALKTSDGRNVFPAFQFDERLQVLPGFAAVLQAFDAKSGDDWTVASWLVTPLRSLEGTSVVEWLRKRRDPAVALAAARRAAAKWAQ